MDMFDLYSRKAHKIRKYNAIYKLYIKLKRQHGRNATLIKDTHILEKISLDFYITPRHAHQIVNAVTKAGGEYNDEPVYSERREA